MDQYPLSTAGRREKARANRAMFDGIAEKYDLLNRLISMGLDRRWRRRLVDLCEVAPGMRCLDLCCGTGDVSRELAQRGGRVIGIDAGRRMLNVAALHGGSILYIQGDALQLPFRDDAFDAVTIAFGNRNVASLEVLYAEMRRVAKPGGRIASLEINRPLSPFVALPFFLYFTHVPPLLARAIGADSAAYRYLPDSVRRYPDAEAVAEIMRQAGLREVTFARRLGGAIAIHRGVA